MGLLLCKKCCCCCCRNFNTNSVDVLPEKNYKLLLLGLTGSGKTELGHLLSKKTRLDFEPTNGVKFYVKQLNDCKLSITEIGGNTEMQKIWQHYYVSAMGIIYCFDLSADYEELIESFQVLRTTMSHPFVQGKPLLLIGTKMNQTNEGIQLFDIENHFHLGSMAKAYLSSIFICTFDAESKNDQSKLNEAISWLANNIKTNFEYLQVRVKGDTNLKKWTQQTNKLIAAGRLQPDKYKRFGPQQNNSFRQRFARFSNSGRFRSRPVRPRTAPPAVYTISYDTFKTQDAKSASVENIAEDVPNTSTVAANGHATAI